MIIYIEKLMNNYNIITHAHTHAHKTLSMSRLIKYSNVVCSIIELAKNFQMKLQLFCCCS